MIYLKNISDDELFSAQLELLMEHGRQASMGANLGGTLAVLGILWPYYRSTELLLWGFGIVMLLLVRSLHMSHALINRHFVRRPRQLFWLMVLGSALTGLVWSGTFIFTSAQLPITPQYMLLMIIVMISAISLALMVVIREYFLVFVFCALWPIAWWDLLHYWDRPENIFLGLLLLAVTGLLVAASNGIHETFSRMLSLTWQQEAASRELGRLTNSLQDRNHQLTDLANIDELTGLGNRRVINKVLRNEISRARRSTTWLAVILIDVDYFKKYNDNYGHPAGDDVLRRIGGLMKRAAARRAGEVVARYGGEEFMVILPGTKLQDAIRTAERVKRLLHDENIPHEFSDVADRVTISQGVFSPATGCRCGSRYDYGQCRCGPVSGQARGSRYDLRGLSWRLLSSAGAHIDPCAGRGSGRPCAFSLRVCLTLFIPVAKPVNLPPCAFVRPARRSRARIARQHARLRGLLSSGDAGFRFPVQGLRLGRPAASIRQGHNDDVALIPALANAQFIADDDLPRQPLPAGQPDAPCRPRSPPWPNSGF